jgi:hypothetical protein
VKNLSDILDPKLFSLRWDSIRLPVELQEIQPAPNAIGLDVIMHDNTDIDQTEWAYQETASRLPY